MVRFRVRFVSIGKCHTTVGDWHRTEHRAVDEWCGTILRTVDE